LSSSQRHDFILLCVGQAINALGDGFSVLGVPLLVLKLTGSPAWLSATSIAYALAAVTGGLLSGVVVDAMGRRRLLVGAQAGQLVFVAIMPGSLWLASDLPAAMALVMVCAVLLGLSGTLFQVGFSTVIPELVPPTELAAANSRVGGLQNVGLLVGPALAGLVAQVSNLTWVFEVDAVTYLASIGSVLWLRDPLPAGERRPQSRLLSGTREAAWAIWRVRRLRSVTAVGFLGYLGTGSFLALLVYRLSSELHAARTTVGLAIAAASAGGIAGSVAAAGLARRARRTQSTLRDGWSVMAGCGCCGLAYLAMAISGVPPAYEALGFAAQTFLGMTVIGVLSLTQRLAPSPVLGGVMGITQSLRWSGILMSSVLMGFLTPLWGAAATFDIFGAVLLVAALLAIGVRNVRLSPDP
jgi:MFS family permease